MTGHDLVHPTHARGAHVRPISRWVEGLFYAIIAAYVHVRCALDGRQTLTEATLIRKIGPGRAHGRRCSCACTTSQVWYYGLSGTERQPKTSRGAQPSVGWAPPNTCRP